MWTSRGVARSRWAVMHGVSASRPGTKIARFQGVSRLAVHRNQPLKIDDPAWLKQTPTKNSFGARCITPLMNGIVSGLTRWVVIINILTE